MSVVIHTMLFGKVGPFGTVGPFGVDIKSQCVQKPCPLGHDHVV